ncbi:MAG: hypothetical protein M1308_17305 [Actinobacteria bacterium]|nr:hypothetical protein [Actinomycetota bacterium]
MKFYIKNEFIYNSIRRRSGDVIDIDPSKLAVLKNMNVIGEPIKEVKIETATVKPKEKEVIRQIKRKKK